MIGGEVVDGAPDDTDEPVSEGFRGPLGFRDVCSALPQAASRHSTAATDSMMSVIRRI
jgi:hypothetical protein